MALSFMVGYMFGYSAGVKRIVAIVNQRVEARQADEASDQYAATIDCGDQKSENPYSSPSE